MKRYLLLPIISFIAISISAQETNYDFGSKIEVKKKEKQVESPYVMFGDNTAVLQTKHEDEKKHVLEIPIIEDGQYLGIFELDFQTSVVGISNIDNNKHLKKKLSENDLARFLSIDRSAEKYYSISPYAYVANNPMKFIDPTGDSIWFSFQDNAVTMHYTAKIINMSSNNTDLSAAASDITTRMQKAFKGATVRVDGKSYELKTNIQISAASSMSDVAISDHLFVMADNTMVGNYGVTNEIGGKVVHLDANRFHNEGFLSSCFGVSNDTYTAVHEAGHTFGLEHPNPRDIGYSRKNIMNQGAGYADSQFFSESVIYNAWSQGNLNKGVNYSIGGGVKIPYQGVHYNGHNGTIGSAGFQYKRR